MIFLGRSIVLLMCLMIKDAACDYSCLCSYQVELEIFDKPDPTSTVDGYMYEFDCKPAYRVAGLNSNYRAIGNEGKLGYVVMTSNIQIQTCQGSIPDIDRVKTTSTVPPSTTTMPTTTTTLATTTTTFPTTKTTKTTTLPTTKTTALPTTKSTTLPPTSGTTKAQTKATTPLATATTDLPTSLKTTTQAATTRPSTASTTIMAITSKPTTKPTSTVATAGLSNTCPPQVQRRSLPQYIFQYGSICYEYVPSNHTWTHAQSHCKNASGHLVSIENESQQAFVSNMLSQLKVRSPVWLGLHDRVNEEQWHLDTGVPASYTNWEPGRYINQYHDEEDCGLLITVHKSRWDDVTCNGITNGKYFSYPWICQYM